jgi:hypothetical protein
LASAKKQAERLLPRCISCCEIPASLSAASVPLGEPFVKGDGEKPGTRINIALPPYSRTLRHDAKNVIIFSDLKPKTCIKKQEIFMESEK